jgi:hypothetical protein
MVRDWIKGNYHRDRDQETKRRVTQEYVKKPSKQEKNGPQKPIKELEFLVWRHRHFWLTPTEGFAKYAANTILAAAITRTALAQRTPADDGGDVGAKTLLYWIAAARPVTTTGTATIKKMTRVRSFGEIAFPLREAADTRPHEAIVIAIPVAVNKRSGGALNAKYWRNKFISHARTMAVGTRIDGQTVAQDRSNLMSGWDVVGLGTSPAANAHRAFNDIGHPMPSVARRRVTERKSPAGE